MKEATEVSIKVTGGIAEKNLFFQVDDISVLPKEGDLFRVDWVRCKVISREFAAFTRKASNEHDTYRVVITAEHIG